MSQGHSHRNTSSQAKEKLKFYKNLNIENYKNLYHDRESSAESLQQGKLPFSL